MFLKLGKKNKSKSIEQEKSYSFKGQIWNSCLDTEKDLLIVETRDSEVFQCWFYAIDLKKNKLLSEFQLPEENWWVGLKYSNDGNYVLYTYEDEQSPVSKGVVVVDAYRGIVLWKKESYCFLDAQGDQMCVTDEENNVNLTVSIESGRVVKYQEQPANKQIQLPARYLQETEFFDQTASLVKLVKNHECVDSIEYLEAGNFLFVSYYVVKDLKQENNLLILTLEGDLIKEFCLSSQSKGIGFGDFVVYKSQVLFAVDNQEFTILPFESIK